MKTPSDAAYEELLRAYAAWCALQSTVVYYTRIPFYARKIKATSERELAWRAYVAARDAYKGVSHHG